MILLSVDPGDACGLLIFERGVAHWHELDPYRCVSEVERTLELWPGQTAHVVAERWVQQSTKMTFQPSALEVIGALRYVTAKAGKDFTLQSRSERTKVLPAQLKAIGWWPTGLEHAQQAAKHAFVRLLRLYPDHDLVRKALGTIAETNEGANQ